MIKYLTSLDTNWGELSATLVEVASTGVDHSWLMRKTAGEQREWLRGLTRPDGHELIHILAVGDDEYYGINRNGDAFSEQDNARVHDRFVKNAKLFRNHKNKHGTDPEFGYPTASYHHPDMKRIELVVAANKRTAGDIIHDVAMGRDAAFSMGANMVHDVCKVCGNKSRTPKEYCIHARRPNLGRVLADGKVCGLDNPDPHYMDISKVGRPADRIAFSVKLLKAAAEGAVLDDDVIGGAERAEQLGLVLPEGFVRSDIPLQKWAALQALAELEKRVPVGMSLVADELGDELPPHVEDKVRERALKRGGLKCAMEDLHSRGIMLRPKQFFRITIGAENTSKTVEPILSEIMAALRRVFSQGVEEGGAGLAEDGRFDGGDIDDVGDTSYRAALDRCVPECSMDDAAASARVIRRSIIDPGKKKVIITKVSHAAEPSVAAQGLASLYAAYQLAFASHPHNHRAALAKHAAVLANAQEH